jgi:hypothetical protein
MSLLWRTAVWWNTDPDDVHEFEEGLRDPEETGKARGQRYVSQVVDRHNVSRSAAEKAVKHVMRHHADDDHRFRSPREYGFASEGDQMRHYDTETTAKLMDPKTWEGRPVQQVSLSQPLHATQNFIRPKSVAHNLFHPGKKQPDTDTEAVGDPDHDPDWSRDDEEWHEEGGETPEQRELHKNVFFMKRNNGKMEVVDGHHRVATDMLLGKKSTPGIVIHENDLKNPAARASDGPVMPKDDLRKHMLEHHGVEDWELPREGMDQSSISWHDDIHAAPEAYGQQTHRHARYQRS